MNKKIPRDTRSPDAAATARQKTDRYFYHGLENQGATCYLNSVLQVLFMTKDFREAVNSLELDYDLSTVASELKRLFEALKERTTDTEGISSKLGIINVYQQQDAAECLEKILNIHVDAPKFFEGRLKYSYTCSNGHETIDRRDSIWILPLSMGNYPHSWGRNYSVTDGFDMFFKPASICGDKMYCDDCQDKAEATIACEMEHPPEILTLLLKRFKVDNYHKTLVKDCCCVEVPRTLLIKSDVYELYAMVDHSGHICGGHYTAKIKSYEDQKWYLFNDTIVTPIQTPPAKSCNVYLIMYRRRQGVSKEMRTIEREEMGREHNRMTKEMGTKIEQIGREQKHMLKKNEMRTREAEGMGREEDHILREQEMRRREEENMRTEKELKRREEDHMWREKEMRRREVEQMRREEEMKMGQIEKEQKDICIENKIIEKEKDLKKREDEMMRREVELKMEPIGREQKHMLNGKRNEDKRRGRDGKRREEELNKREEEHMLKENEMRRGEPEVREVDQ